MYISLFEIIIVHQIKNQNFIKSLFSNSSFEIGYLYLLHFYEKKKKVYELVDLHYILTLWLGKNSRFMECILIVK
jgi:hypothetical protein